MKNKKSTFVIMIPLFNALLFATLFSSSTALCTSGWKSGGANGEDDDKQHINFYGTLITHQGQKDAVGHILIEGKHNDIVMYDAPVKHAKEQLNQKTKQTEIKLDENPITDFMHSKIDLSTVSCIKVPTPNTVWVYQKEKRYQRMEFILVTVTLKEGSTPKDYLLERKTHISCNTIDNGAQKKDVPLSAVDTLTIEGYSFTLGTDQIKENRPAPCPTKVSLLEKTIESEMNEQTEEPVTT